MTYKRMMELHKSTACVSSPSQHIACTSTEQLQIGFLGMLLGAFIVLIWYWYKED